MPFQEIEKNFPDEYNLWINDMYNCTCPNGESVAEFVIRVTDTVTKIAQENDGNTVCIASHATPIRVICCHALGIDPKDLKSVPWSPNASINIINFENGKFSIIKRDIVEHLKDFMTNLPKNI